MLQHGAYTLLIDACYDRETFPTLTQALCWTWASSDEQTAAVTFVLSKFFVLENDIYKQPDIAADIEKRKQGKGKAGGGDASMFEQFWLAYPRKIAKTPAKKAFDKLQPTSSLLAAMLAAIKEQRKCDQWQKNNGQFIPYPATWLNSGRWDDDMALSLHEHELEDWT